ncbi:MAG: CHAT domain-containing protein [Oligoflexales bacterium]|nr:CHAT domain-containing protein [Oligoflexales bacterium]
MTKAHGSEKHRHKGLLIFVVGYLFSLACSRSLSVNTLHDKFDREQGLKFFEPFQLTAGSESNFSPDLSPDGAFILYTSDRSGNKDIWRKRTSGGFAKALSFHSADDLAPVISPDGDQVAFVSRRQDAAGDIHVMGIKGEKKSKIKGIKHPLFEDSEPSWFPNGERIIFASRTPGNQIPALMTASLGDLTAQALGSVRGTQAKVFPNGNQVVYVNQGSLYVYDEQKHRSQRLTHANGPQDGQPYIAQDGETLLFIRYTDDTNDDGLVNADDRASIWSLDLKAQSQETELENYTLTPLTSAKISAYSPQIRENRLYLTKQTGFGLDIYYLPTYGQIAEPESLDEVRSWFHRLTDPHDKTYLLRRSSAAFYKKGQKKIAAEIALWELNWQIEQNHKLEAQWVYKKLNDNFPKLEELVMLAKLSMVELGLMPFSKLLSQELDDFADKKINQFLQTTNDLKKQAESKQYQRALAKAYFVSAKIKAVLGEHYAASQVYSQVAADFSDIDSIAAKSMYEHGRLLTGLSGKESAIAKLTEMIARYPEQADEVMKASKLAVSLVEESKKPEAAIHLLRTQNLELPILPAYAHLRIAERFSRAKKDIVAANEYRAMIDLYPHAPQILLTAAQRLASIVEREGRIEEAESIIHSLYQQFKKSDNSYLNEVAALLIALLSRKGEGLIRKNRLSEALNTYETIIKLKPDDLNGYRGVIKVKFLQGKLDDVIASWEDRLDKDRSLTALYALAYANTFKLETSESLGEKVAIIEEAIEMLEQVRELNDQVPQVHQTLGWLYQQNDYWLDEYERKGGLSGALGEGWNSVNLFKVAYLSLDLRVLNPFRDEPKNFLDLSVDSYLAAYHLSKPHSVARAHLAQNLAHTYYSLGNFKKAIHFYSERIADIKVIPVEPLAAEALFWQRSGRSAFQVGETRLAAALQKKAILVWEQAGFSEPLAHSMDSLALSLSELKANLKAREYYFKLIDEHRKNQRYKNLNKVYINLALTYRDEKEYSKALSMLDEADKVTVDFALPKDFSLHQRLITNSIRIELFELSGFHRLQYDALVAKVALLEEKYQVGQEKGQSKSYLLLDRCIAYNQLGNLNKEDGQWNKGIDSFQKALEISQKKREGQDDKLAASEELANLLSLGRMELVGLESGVYRPKKLEALLEAIDRELRIIYPQNKNHTEENEETQKDYVKDNQNLKNLPEQTFSLLSLKGMLLSYKTQYSKEKKQALEPFEESLKDSLNRSFEVASVQKKLPLELPSLYLDWKQRKYDPLASSQSLEAMVPIINESFSRNHYSFWKYMSGVADWPEAVKALESYILSGGVLESYTDRRLARKSFESLYQGPEKQGFFDAFKSYQSLKLREMLWRTYNWGPQTKGKEGKNRYLKSFRARYDDLLRKKSLDSIKESLKDHEAVLAVHKFIESDRLWIAWVDKDDYLERERRLSVAQSFESVLSFIKNFPINEKGISQIYIVASEELYAQNWEALYTHAPSLKANGGISFLPSLDVLPIVSEQALSGRYYLGISGEGKAGLKQDAYNNYLQFTFDHKKTQNLAAEISSYQLVQSNGLLNLSSFEPKRSEWVLSSSSIGTPKNRLRMRDLAGIKEHQTAAIIFPKVAYLRDEVLDEQGFDAWIALWFASYTTGTNNLILESPRSIHRKKSEKKKVDLRAFYEAAQSGSFASAIRKSGLSMRSIGYESMLDEDDIEDLADETLELFEEYQDEGELEAARSQLLKLIYLYKRGEMEDDFWESMSQLAWLFYRLKEFNKALTVQKLVAQSILSREEDDIAFAENLMNAANFAHFAEDYEESNRLLAECERIFLNEEDLISTANVWHLRAVNAEKKGKYKEAIAAYKKSLEIFAEEEEEVEVAKKYRAIGTIYQIRLNSYGKAIAYFRKAAEILLELEEEKVLALVYIETANTYIAMGQVGGAIQILERANELIDEEEETILKIRALQNLGIAFLRRNLLLDAQNTVEKNYLLIDDLDDEDPIQLKMKRQLYIDALNLEGMIAAKRGQEEKSFATFDRALSLARKHNFSAKVAFILNNYGFWSREFGQLEASIEYMEEALKIDKLRKARTDEAYDLRNLGLSAIVLGQKDRARQLLQDALKTSKELGISYNLIYCHIGLGDLAFLDKKWKLARNHYKNGLGEAKRKHIDDFVWKTEAAIAKTYMQESNTQEANNSLQRALKVINDQPPGLSSQSSRTRLSTEMGVQEVYEQLIKVALKQKRYEDAWSLSEQAKLRQMVDSLGFLNLPYSGESSMELVAAIRDAKNRVLNHKVELDEELSKNPEALNQWQLKNRKLRELYEQKLSELEKNDPQAGAFLRIKTVRMPDLQKALSQERGLISYFILENELLIFLVHKNQFNLKRVKVDRETLKRKLSDFKTIMEHYSAIHFMAESLYDLLIEPIAEEIFSLKSLGVSPHRFLHQLAFSSLYDGKQFLLERFNLFFLESLSALARLPKKAHPWSQANTKIMAFADPELEGQPALPFARREVASLARYFKHVDQFIGKEAKKSELKKLEKGYDILHVASHGTFIENAPQMSSLAFYGQLADSKLQAQEVFSVLSVPYLVTLSACDSGIGQLNQGEPSIGFERAFFYSGAKALVSSLWRIDDVASAVVMKRFYRYLSEGLPLSEALRESQLQVRRFFKHPAYWASFKLSGSYH